MALDRVQIRTRFGQLLETVTAEALRLAGLTFTFDWQYEADCIKLDFCIPKGAHPSTIIEVTQTEARNVLQRKLLRYFEQVAQAKTFFGPNVAVASLIYGQPTKDLPPATLASSLSFFDASLLPRVDPKADAKTKEAIGIIESRILKLAATGVPTEADIAALLKESEKQIHLLAEFFKQRLPRIKSNPVLKDMWVMERNRTSSLKLPKSLPPIKTDYKRSFLQTLFLPEGSFKAITDALINPKTGHIGTTRLPPGFPQEALDNITRLRLGQVTNAIGGKRLTLTASLLPFIDDPTKRQLVITLRSALAKNKLRWFFEDVRDAKRRQKMARHYLEVASQGEKAMKAAIYANLVQDDYNGIPHSRCWLADLMAIHLETSQNILNTLIVAEPEYTADTGKPFNDITMKFARIMGSEVFLREHALLAARIWARLPHAPISAEALADKLLSARIDGAMYLQKFNPFYVVIEKVLREKGWTFQYLGIATILGDLLDNPQVGRFKVYQASRGAQTLILNGLQILDAHKPKEWAARGRALRYRLVKVDPSNPRVETQLEHARFIFVLDGDVTERMRRQLEWAGWRTCTLEELPSVLPSA